MDEAADAVRAMDDRDPDRRLAAVVRIAERRLRVDVARLHAALVDPDLRVRAATAFALAKVGDVSSLDALYKAWAAANAEESHLRRQLLIAMGDLGGAAAIAPVLRDFSAWENDLRQVALDFLAVRGDAEAARPLLRRLLDQPLDADTRALVVAALQR